MKTKSLRIVFMGTPEFAVASLSALLQSAHDVVAVVTMPDKPAGRGKQISESDVKRFAVEHQIPIMQPANLKSNDFVEELKSFNADLHVVVAFRMLPEVVWAMPKYGTINLHASLLPNYRGAAPINHAIINGEIETGVTTFLLDKEIDTGRIILQKKVAVEPHFDAGILHDRLMEIGSGLLVETIDLISTGDFETIPQSVLISSELKHAPKIFKDDCRINWDSEIVDIHNFIRGLSPYPAAFTMVNGGQVLKIFKTKILDQIHGSENGVMFETDMKNYINVKTKSGILSIEELQIQGKKRMETKEFLRGFRDEIIVD